MTGPPADGVGRALHLGGPIVFRLPPHEGQPGRLVLFPPILRLLFRIGADAAERFSPNVAPWVRRSGIFPLNQRARGLEKHVERVEALDVEGLLEGGARCTVHPVVRNTPELDGHAPGSI